MSSTDAARAAPWLARLGGLGLLAVVCLLGTYLLAPSALFPAWGPARDALAGLAAQDPPRLDTRARRLAALALAAQEDRRVSTRTFAGLSLPLDIRSCGRALGRNLREGGVREGCSTVAMQLAG